MDHERTVGEAASGLSPAVGTARAPLAVSRQRAGMLQTERRASGPGCRRRGSVAKRRRRWWCRQQVPVLGLPLCLLPAGAAPRPARRRGRYRRGAAAVCGQPGAYGARRAPLPGAARRGRRPRRGRPPWGRLHRPVPRRGQLPGADRGHQCQWRNALRGH